MSCSVLILTYNEAVNIAACIGSLPWHDDVHVLDSGSTDETATIAERMGATVHFRTFTNYADQRNFGFSLPFRHDWIVMLDADERMSADLAAEIDRFLVRAGSEFAMARVRRKDIFMGRWLQRSSGYPTWFTRIVRRGRVRVERDVNEEYVPDGRVEALAGHILHYPFNKGIDWWFERHNRYSTMEAERLQMERSSARIAFSDAFARDAARRRACLKQILYRIPGRHIVVFLYLYVFRLGFLDGRPGYTYALMRAAYEIMIDAKMTANRMTET
jgi:glycosyltransferase involved in cell wall biosynthesis